MAKLGPSILVLLASSYIMLPGCGGLDVPYTYISLEQSMKVEEYGKSHLVESRNPELFNHQTMPVRYAISEATYNLVARVDLESHQTAIIYDVESDGAERLSLEAKGIHCYLFVDDYFQPKRQGYSERSVRLVWKDRASPYCEKVRRPAPADTKINIDVFGADGLIARHEFGFEVLRNGVARYYDSL